MKGADLCNGGRVFVQGTGPGPRYGHVMSLVGQRFLLSISGSDGKYQSALFPVCSKNEFWYLCAIADMYARQATSSRCMGSGYSSQTL
jgi:hypothetical protein